MNRPILCCVVATCLLGAVNPASGQPKIVAHPRDTGVTLGTDARLIVAATGAPLTFQWHSKTVPGYAVNHPDFTVEQVLEFDARISEGLKALQAEFDLTIFRPDVFPYFEALRENPAAYGFTRQYPADWGLSGPFGPDFSCDSGHFTEAVHRLMVRQLYPAMTPPLRLNSPAQPSGNSVTLQWTGGAPPHRLQRSSELQTGSWEAIGDPATHPTETVEGGSPRFFRVLSLGQ